MAETQKYDVAVIGAGPAGLAAAEDLKAAGKSVVVIEKYLWGGTCPNYGCDAKKLLLAGVEAREAALALDGQGLKSDVTIDWPALMAHKKGFTDSMPGRTEASLRGAGIDCLTSAAQFTGANTLVVAGEDGDINVEATDIVIAVGERPAELNVPGGELAIDSEAFLSLPEMSKNVTIIGGGYIAVEFATIAASTGAQVNLLIRSDRALRGFDEDLVSEQLDELADRGVRVYYNTGVNEIKAVDDKFSVSLSFGSELPTDLVVRAVGRTPNSDKLALEQAGVAFDEHGVNVDGFLRTNNPHVYAIGDVANSPVPRLTTTGYFEGRYVAQVILGATEEISYPLIPMTVFGLPKLGSVGVQPSEAAAQGLQVRDLDMTSWFSYYRVGESKVHAKIVLNQAGQMVGATVLGSHADELTNYFTDIISRGGTYDDIRQRLYSYPSLASDLEYFF